MTSHQISMHEDILWKQNFSPLKTLIGKANKWSSKQKEMIPMEEKKKCMLHAQTYITVKQNWNSNNYTLNVVKYA